MFREHFCTTLIALVIIITEGREASIASILSTIIAPGVNLPMVSLGCGSGQKGDVVNATKLWIQAGGTGFDTAYDYEDQADIAKGLKLAHVQAKDVFITTKVPCGTFEDATQHIQDNLKQLQVSSVDLLLIHSDHPFSPPYDCNIADTWRALENSKTAGTARAIGVSHFSVAELKALSSTPSVNQCSLSVRYHDDATIQYCKDHGITYMSFSPLCGGANGSSCTHGSVLTLKEVISIAQVHNVSPAQIGLKWIIQQNIPLTTAAWIEDYMKQDLDLWSWGNLTQDEMSQLSAVKRQR